MSRLVFRALHVVSMQIRIAIKEIRVHFCVLYKKLSPLWNILVGFGRSLCRLDLRALQVVSV